MKIVKGKIEWEVKLRNVQHPLIHIQQAITENRAVLETLLKKVKKICKQLEIK